MRKVMAKDRKTLINHKLNILFCRFSVACALVLCYLAVGTTEVFAEELPKLKSKAQQHAEDISHFIPNNQIKFLPTGDQEFIALYQEQHAGLTKGTAIIVPDIEQPIYQQAAISSLYDKLNDYGWNSLLLTMPDSLIEIIEDDAASENDTNNEQPASTNTEVDTVADTADETAATESEAKDPNLQLKSYYTEPQYTEKNNGLIRDEIQRRLSAAFDFATTAPGYFLVICQGKSCAWLVDIITTSGQFNPDALIMLSAFMPQQDLNDKLAEQVSTSEFAILDLYQRSDNNWILKNVEQRKRLSKKNFKIDFRQRQMQIGVNYFGQQSRTLKEIYGFITYLGM